jgi:MFS family permease
MGVYSALRMLGFASGPLVGGFLQSRVGFSAAFYAGAGTLFFSAILVQLWIDEPPPRETEASRVVNILSPNRAIFLPHNLSGWVKQLPKNCHESYLKIAHFY